MLILVSSDLFFVYYFWL